MEFRILGPLEVTAQGRPVVLPGSRERAVLVLLLLSANRVVPAERLVEDLWDGKAQKGAAGALRVFISRLRKALREGGGDALVVTKPPGYLLQIERAALDAARFEDLLAEGREHAAQRDHEGAAARLRQALSLWRGPALADLADVPVARAEATRLEEARLAALEERVEADLGCGRHAEVVPELDHLTKVHSLRERLWGQRMVALYRSGRQADALRVYQELRRLLAEELGLEPSLEVARLENAILRQAPELQAPQLAARCARRPSPGSGEPTTFLFSDIEASTRRWEGDPEAMTVDLARHDELLRAAIEAAGGEVFSHTGDGMAAAFRAAPDALAAAVAAQQALACTAWAAPGPLRVRMAIHAGVAQRREDNYFGPALNRVARLLATASGGQVLCSHAAAELIGADLPADVVLLDLGEHRLADLARVERVFQVAHPALSSQFPALRSLAGHRHNLPMALTPFIGRARELDELGTLLAGSRLLTLTGVGGAGKTRLALQGAAAARPAYPDGVWIAELAPLREGAQAASAVAAALTFETSAFDSPEAVEDRLIRYLATRQTLVLLDNCEHLIEPVARLVHALVTRCPSVTVLATSRERLGVPGEVVWKVPPMSMAAPGAALAELTGSDAVAFFCERARAARSTFELDTTNAAAVARVCRRLDGIPLALELAAARIQVLSPAQVAERLDDRFRLLTGRERIVVPHQQTLRATVDWSYGLLSPAEQRALTWLAIFPDTFDLPAAEAVMSGGDGGVAYDEALDVLCRLVDKSLIVVHSEGAAPRYRLLETIRQYGAEKLAEAGEEAIARRRHRDAFVACVQAWRGTPLGSDFLCGAFADAENFRAALEWSWTQRDADAVLLLIGALGVPWLWFGYPDGQIWIERIFSEPEFSAPELADHPGHVDALAIRAILLPEDDRDRCDELLDEAAALARRIGDNGRAAYLDWGRAEYKLLSGKAAEARSLLEVALAGYERLGLPDGIGWCHHHLGWAAVTDGQYDRARDHFERAVEVARSDPLGEWVEPHALAALGPLVALSGDGERALRLAEQAVGAARRLKAPPVLAMTLTRAAETAVLAGHPRRAAGILVELLGLLADQGTRRWVADALETAALILEIDDAERASAILGAADRLREAIEVRTIAEEVRHARDRLAGALGAERFALHEARGRTLSHEAAVTLTLAGLAARGYDVGQP
ncbi:MAG TPA: BTAD domain-containing putative transcriptional regulator [Pseudonocardiaceae bacterium]|nr:BTAD domain-containing putative transcriptional regulator [Pseudonocardiaceae bacterium]